MTVAIENYALIGDCRSAALVSRDGAIDWLCWPRFESAAIFGALLDEERGGTFRIAPTHYHSVSRRYLEDSAVLETTFDSSEGQMALLDAMPIADAADVSSLLIPEHELIRIVRCTTGSVELDVKLAARPDFGRGKLTIKSHGKLGIRLETAQGLLTLRTNAPPAQLEQDDLVWRLQLRAGDSLHFSLTWTADAPAVLPPVGAWTERSLERTLRHWRAWSSRTKYEGPARSEVVRSAITVRLLAYAPSGAIIAAPTTSLPETIGGEKNWDYRYCWLRDAAFTVRGMLELGHTAEAVGFTHWLLHATRLTQPRLMVLYDVFGRMPPKEKQVAHLSGYQSSRPVQVGNAADGQIQLDSYGEVIDAVWRITRAGIPLDRETSRTIEAFGRYVCAHWTEPDAGIWESRGQPRQHTHSIALCWTALDRLIDLQASGHLRPRFRELFGDQRAHIARELRARAFNRKLHSYTSELDSETLDATSLLLVWYGFERASSPTMKSTFARIVRELSPRPGLLYRNRTPPANEGAFGICSFWLSEYLARGGGSAAQARAAFEQTCAFLNDVGLMAEEIDVASGRALGNFPQTFSHVGLINAALSVAQRERAEATT